MSDAKRYLLDANIFITAHRTYYAFDICPGFWRALLEQNHVNRVCSIDRVRAELVSSNDELSAWVKKVPDAFFSVSAEKDVVESYGKLVNWVQNEQQFTSAAKAEFSSVADGWIIAFAQVKGLIVVTHEQYAPEAQRRVPIPNACLEHGVEYCNTFDMLRDLETQFDVRKRVRKN